MQKKEVKLVKLAGCEGCTKNCQFNGNVAVEANKQRKYACNNSQK